MASFIDKFTTNALQTPVGLMISRASDEVLPTEDWCLIMEICDYINTREEGPKDAARALRKRLQMTKSTKCTLYCLTILETCMKNCGYRFQINICQKDYVQELVKLLQPTRNPSLSVQEKIVSLIQNWTDAFSSHPDLKGVALIREELRMKGIIFPDSDPDEVKLLKSAGGVGFGTTQITPGEPIRTASFSIPPTQQVPVARPPSQTIPPHPQRKPTSVDQPHVTPANSPNTAPGGALNQSQIHKLQRDLDVVQTNCRILADMLSQLNPGEEEAAEYALLKDLNSVCRQMQSRLMELIEQVSSEEITCELLRVNDDLNQVFVRFDRYERIREVHMKKTQSAAQSSVLMGSGNSVPTAPARNKSLQPDDFFGDSNHDVAVMPVGATVPVIKKRASEQPSAFPSSRMHKDLGSLTLDDTDGFASGGNATNAASNPTYEELLFSAAAQSPIEPGDPFATNEVGVNQTVDPKPKSSGDGQFNANASGLTEQDIDSFLNDGAAAGANTTGQPIAVKPAQSFLNPFES